MGIYRYSSITDPISFINDLGMMILHIINETPRIIAREIHRILTESGFYTSKSQIYRYLSTLREYGLISHNGWERGVGYRYIIENEAIRYLEFSRPDLII